MSYSKFLYLVVDLAVGENLAFGGVEPKTSSGEGNHQDTPTPRFALIGAWMSHRGETEVIGGFGWAMLSK